MPYSTSPLALIVAELKVKTLLIVPVRPQYAIEEHGRMNTLHLLVHRINVVDTGIDRYREVIGGAHVHIRP